MQQLRAGTIVSRCLPKPLRKLLDNQRWLPLERSKRSPFAVEFYFLGRIQCAYAVRWLEDRN